MKFITNYIIPVILSFATEHFFKGTFYIVFIAYSIGNVIGFSEGIDRRY